MPQEELEIYRTEFEGTRYQLYQAKDGDWIVTRTWGPEAYVTDDIVKKIVRKLLTDKLMGEGMFAPKSEKKHPFTISMMPELKALYISGNGIKEHMRGNVLTTAFLEEHTVALHILAQIQANMAKEPNI